MSIVNTGRIGGVLICSLAGRSVCRLIGQPRVLARGRAFTCGGLRRSYLSWIPMKPRPWLVRCWVRRRFLSAATNTGCDSTFLPAPVANFVQD